MLPARFSTRLFGPTLQPDASYHFQSQVGGERSFLTSEGRYTRAAHFPSFVDCSLLSQQETRSKQACKERDLQKKNKQPQPSHEKKPPLQTDLITKRAANIPRITLQTTKDLHSWSLHTSSPRKDSFFILETSIAKDLPTFSLPSSEGCLLSVPSFFFSSFTGSFRALLPKLLKQRPCCFC